MTVLPLNRSAFNPWGLSGFLLSILLLLAGCASDTEPSDTSQTFEAVGVVKTITPTKNYINIDHEDIPGFMDAMTMFFPVLDTSILQNVAVNDSVVFTIEIIEGNAVVSAIKVND